MENIEIMKYAKFKYYGKEIYGKILSYEFVGVGGPQTSTWATYRIKTFDKKEIEIFRHYKDVFEITEEEYNVAVVLFS